MTPWILHLSIFDPHSYFLVLSLFTHVSVWVKLIALVKKHMKSIWFKLCCICNYECFVFWCVQLDHWVLCRIYKKMQMGKVLEKNEEEPTAKINIAAAEVDNDKRILVLHLCLLFLYLHLFLTFLTCPSFYPIVPPTLYPTPQNFMVSIWLHP